MLTLQTFPSTRSFVDDMRVQNLEKVYHSSENPTVLTSSSQDKRTVRDQGARYTAKLGGGGGGETSIRGVRGGVPCFRVIFSRKNSEKCMSIFHKNSVKGYNIWRKFQTGSVIYIWHK